MTSYTLPIAPGIPPVLGGIANLVATPALVAADAVGLPQPSIQPSWGIFLSGAPIIVADSVISMDARQEWVIADYPIETGAFQSYDKVQRPFDVRFRFAMGGNASKRNALISSVKAIAGDFNLYTFIAPDDVWTSVNVSHFEYHRAAQNVGLLVVDVWGWQIQVNTSSGVGLANAQSPASPNPVVNNVSPSTASPIGQGGIGSDAAVISNVQDSPYFEPTTSGSGGIGAA